MDICPSVAYKPSATSLRGKTGYIIIFTLFEEGGLLSKTRNDAESGDKSDDDSTMPPLLSEGEMDAMDSSDESDYDPISKGRLEDILDISQYHPNVNRREARYKILDCIKQRQPEYKRALKAT